MFDTFLIPQSLPFAIALTVVAGLFILEIVSALLGGTILGMGGEGPDMDVDMDADFDLSADLSAELDADIDVELDADIPADTGEMPRAPSGLLGVIGARDVPFLIWLVSFLTMFGMIGLIIQSAALGLIGTPLFAALAVVLAAVPSLAVTRVIANWVALIMPKTETSALRKRYLGGHRGIITQGTASRGKPAEVKIQDRHGNIHYLRVEPLDDDGVYPQGSDVTLIRKRGDRFFVI